MTNEFNKFTKANVFIRNDIETAGYLCVTNKAVLLHYFIGKNESTWFLDIKVSAKVKTLKKNDIGLSYGQAMGKLCALKPIDFFNILTFH